MKKNITKLVLLLITVLSLFFTSCKNEDNPTTHNTVYYVDISAETDWDYMLVGDDGSSVFVNLNEESNIPPHLFFKPNKNRDNGYTIFFQDNGLPQAMIFENHILYMGNFKGTKFDMGVIYPDKSIKYFFDIDANVNWDDYVDFSKISGKTAKNDTSPKISLGNVGVAIGVASCVAGMRVSPADALLGCGSTIAEVSTDNKDLSKKVVVTGIGAIITVIGCTSTGGIPCLLGIAASASSGIGLAFDIFGNNSQGIVEISETLKFKPYLIQLSSDKVEVPCYSPYKTTITVSTESQWVVNKLSFDEWCIATKIDNKTIEIEVLEEYKGYGSRDNSFAVCPNPPNEKIPCAYFKVEQFGANYTISKKNLTFKAIGGQDGFTVTVEPPLMVESAKVALGDDSWCHVTMQGGGSNSLTSVNVKVDPNENKERNAFIEVNFKMGEKRFNDIVQVKQEGKEGVDVTFTINNATNITTNSVTFTASVTTNSTVTDKGICYSAHNNMPTTNDSKISLGGGTGSFTTPISYLSENTTYYVRPYAIINGTSYYGEVKTFKTLQGEAPSIIGMWTFSCTNDPNFKNYTHISLEEGGNYKAYRGLGGPYSSGTWKVSGNAITMEEADPYEFRGTINSAKNEIKGDVFFTWPNAVKSGTFIMTK